MIGWKFLLSLLPEPHPVGHFNHEPTFRPWVPERTNQIDREHYWQVTEAVFQLCLERVATDASLWPGLVGHLDRLPTDYQAQAYDLLEAQRSFMTAQEQFAAWEAIDTLARRHREHSDAKWALSVDALSRLDDVARNLQPARASLRNRWLFDSSMPDLGIRKSSKVGDYDSELTRRRSVAIHEIWQEGGLELLLEMAQVVESPWSLGQASGRLQDLDAEAVGGLIDDDSKPISDFAVAAVRAKTLGVFEQLRPLVNAFGGRAEVQARLLLLADDLPEAWAAAEALGPDVDQRYWAGFYPFGRGADFPLVNETARRLIDHQRWATALDLLSHFVKRQSLDEALIIEAFTSMLRSGDAELHVLSEYEITNLMTYLRQSEKVDDATLVRLEWQLLPVLDLQSDTSALQRTLSDSPEFFVEVLSLLYRPKKSVEEEEVGRSDFDKNVASNAWRLLHDWQRVPGTVGQTSEIDLNALTTWTKKVRELAGAADRLDVAESQLGQVLAFSPSDEDGTWPGLPVRTFLEAEGSPRILSGFQMGAYNKRGVTTRGVTEGGAQEYELARQYLAWADKVKVEWPKTARALRDLAEGYRAEGLRNDEAAQRVQEGFGY